jgi:hypothetical protein
MTVLQTADFFALQSLKDIASAKILYLLEQDESWATSSVLKCAVRGVYDSEVPGMDLLKAAIVEKAAMHCPSFAKDDPGLKEALSISTFAQDLAAECLHPQPGTYPGNSALRQTNGGMEYCRECGRFTNARHCNWCDFIYDA